MTAGVLDLLALGRISVDLYAQEPGASFLEPQTFVKSIGGSPSNVAVAAARLGLHSAVVTAVGADPLGEYAVAKLAALGVETRYVAVRQSGRTPVVLVALEDPAEPTITFLREPDAPDTMIESNAVDATTVATCRVLWTSGATLAAGPTARTAMRWLEQRARRPHTVLDLDLRPSLWSDPSEATAAAARAIELSSIVIGNRAECAMALGCSEPHAAADALLSRGVTTAIVKMGSDGVLLATADERVVVDPVPVTARCGSGAGDAFGGALAAGLVNGWPLARTGWLANAAGALVTSRLTCADAMPTLAELEAFVAGTGQTSTPVTSRG
ncbi:MAG: 5-dehydro-2-deoxygluconokinase [Actinomycetota bacterium]|nr:5-dehydro-2-deoxygluconokinase [Actinomycetota bacterium]